MLGGTSKVPHILWLWDSNTAIMTASPTAEGQRKSTVIVNASFKNTLSLPCVMSCLTLHNHFCMRVFVCVCVFLRERDCVESKEK